jgi:hypothetical protein
MTFPKSAKAYTSVTFPTESPGGTFGPHISHFLSSGFLANNFLPNVLFSGFFQKYFAAPGQWPFQKFFEQSLFVFGVNDLSKNFW